MYKRRSESGFRVFRCCSEGSGWCFPCALCIEPPTVALPRCAPAARGGAGRGHARCLRSLGAGVLLLGIANRDMMPGCLGHAGARCRPRVWPGMYKNASRATAACGRPCEQRESSLLSPFVNDFAQNFVPALRVRGDTSLGVAKDARAGRSCSMWPLGRSRRPAPRGSTQIHSRSTLFDRKSSVQRHLRGHAGPACTMGASQHHKSKL